MKPYSEQEIEQLRAAIIGNANHGGETCDCDLEGGPDEDCAIQPTYVNIGRDWPNRTIRLIATIDRLKHDREERDAE
jgi:hypothetical protein